MTSQVRVDAGDVAARARGAARRARRAAAGRGRTASAEELAVVDAYRALEAGGSRRADGAAVVADRRRPGCSSCRWSTSSTARCRRSPGFARRPRGRPRAPRSTSGDGGRGDSRSVTERLIGRGGDRIVERSRSCCAERTSAPAGRSAPPPLRLTFLLERAGALAASSRSSPATSPGAPTSRRSTVTAPEDALRRCAPSRASSEVITGPTIAPGAPTSRRSTSPTALRARASRRPGRAGRWR